MGGSSGTTQSDSQFAPINTMPRAGKYTKLFDLGSSVLDSITYNGTLSDGARSITYKVADDTAVYGATVYNSDTLPGSLPAACTVATATNPTRYIMLTVTLDDTYSAGFPDINSAKRNVTDVTVLADSLRSPTNQRLFHGKWFKSEAQQPLDTCAT